MKVTHEMVYIWQLPIRLYHWVNALAIGVLFFTGIYIARPFFGPVNTAGDATFSFVMGNMVYIHMVAAYIFIFNFLFRIYWWIAGNAYSRFRYQPWTRQFWASLWRTVRFYLLLEKEEEDFPGHNPLAELSYFFFLWFATLFMIVTGFALYAAIVPDGALFASFTWVITALGGMPYARYFHHLFAWAFVVFVTIHLYLCIRHDLLTKDGTMSSIITGWKYKDLNRT
ncbi:MAG: Ni/Fe-hydrogenase, b-type cytochrome subunit [Heliobacteriaceae bacterium]|nr:Ni/Fe-hydrogenase, b-type cytochrome subunit [Heliobacteriaceae bacterium]MDD4587091.1 Ni/Fe-hydrogenase, b-type cytochrome subunit [Heliobacteriaceae bacterium]